MNSLLHIAHTAAAHARKVVMSHYAETAYEVKDDLSPVTVADRAAHDIIMEHLTATGIAILSEEAEGVPLPYPERIWIVDPLDGTKGFIRKTGDFSIMIALLEEGRPVLAVVDAPVMDRHYFALRGEGAYVVKNGETRKLQVSDRVAPTSRGLLSVNHAQPYMLEVMETLGVTEIIQVGSVGIKAGHIADNLADFYLNRGALGEWDVCAPELILTEAGGTVTDVRGELLMYGNPDHRITHGIVFSNTACHNEVVKTLSEII
jgi:3'(2'), 5'-bisphosphate nucleotidase